VLKVFLDFFHDTTLPQRTIRKSRASSELLVSLVKASAARVAGLSDFLILSQTFDGRPAWTIIILACAPILASFTYGDL